MTNATKQRSEMMRRRKLSLFKNAYELGKLCDADVAVIVCKNGRFYIYKSTDQKSWPPPMEQIASSVPSFIFNTKMLIKIANCVSAAGNRTSETPRSLEYKVSHEEE